MRTNRPSHVAVSNKRESVKQACHPACSAWRHCAPNAHRYETGFNNFSGPNFTTAAQDTAFANTTMLQRLATLIANGQKAGGNAVIIGEWGLAGERVIS